MINMSQVQVFQIVSNKEKINKDFEDANAKEEDLLSNGGLLSIKKYTTNNKEVYTLIDDKITGKTLLINIDLEKIINDLLYQLEQGLNKYFGNFDNMDIWDYEIEFYRTFPREDLLDRYTATVKIPIKLTNMEYEIKEVDVRQTIEYDIYRGGIRVYVDLKDVLDIIYKYIEILLK